jgi:hypothetical protein
MREKDFKQQKIRTGCNPVITSKMKEVYARLEEAVGGHGICRVRHSLQEDQDVRYGPIPGDDHAS